jgi:hypothetical protein
VSKAAGWLFFVLLAAAGTASAFLPPDASVREPEIRAYRRKIRQDYEKRIEERRDKAALEYERATIAIDLPPWELERVMKGESLEEIRAAAAEERVSVRKPLKKRFLVSIVLFILIGSAVVWVRRATRDEEE